MKQTTLADLGAQLPIGVPTADGKLNKSFSVKPFRLKEEKELAALKEKGGMNLGKYVSHVLAVMLDQVGGQSFKDLKMEQRLYQISKMYMCDVLYMYVYLRTDALGTSLKMKIPCGRCKAAFDFAADLNTLDVKTVDGLQELVTECELRHGFTYRGATRKKVQLRPVLWNVFESKSSKDMGALRGAIIQNAIVGIEGIAEAEMSVIPDATLDELTKRDVETITGLIDGKTPGPIMAVAAECPECDSKWMGSIDWGYDSFFSHSSL